MEKLKKEEIMKKMIIMFCVLCFFVLGCDKKRWVGVDVLVKSESAGNVERVVAIPSQNWTEANQTLIVTDRGVFFVKGMVSVLIGEPVIIEYIGCDTGVDDEVYISSVRKVLVIGDVGTESRFNIQ